MSSTAVARRNAAAIQSKVGDLDVMQLGQVLAQSGYFKDAKDASQAIVKVLFGREIGIGPVSAMMGIHVIEGRCAPSANLIAARVKSSGRYDYRVREHSAERCRIEFFERGGAQGWDSLGTIEWNMEDARRAGLGGRGPWKSYPRAMLFARAISEGARVHCPELFGGAPVYTPEELGAEVDGEGNLIVPPAPASNGDGAKPGLLAATDAQLDLIIRMKDSHLVTDTERKGIERRLGNGMSKLSAASCIDWLKEAIEYRGEAEKQAAAIVDDYEPQIADRDDEPAYDMADEELLF